MLFFTPHITARLSYIVKLLFNEILGIEVILTTDSNIYSNSNDIKICYDSIYNEKGFFIERKSLLLEEDIKPQSIECFKNNDFVCFFKNGKDCNLGFDIFAAAFYLVSRYEEYLPFIPDKHGRFQAEHSLAFKNQFLHIPLVQIWAYYLIEKLESYYKQPIKVKKNKPALQITFDLDNVYAYKGKSFSRFIGGLAKDIIYFRFKNAAIRTLVCLNIRKDPYDNYEHFKNLKEKNISQWLFFILFAEKGKFDVGISPRNTNLKNLINILSTYATIGIHPSYASSKDLSMLKKEIESYKSLNNTNYYVSRQHFLLLSLPETYRRLIENGIFEDFSMGYASNHGYRASIAIPYTFFDLIKNEETKLIIHPFALMDTSFTDYLHCDKQKIKETYYNYYETTRKCGGNLCCVFHDRSFDEFSDSRFFWNEILEELLAWDKQNATL